MTHTRTDEAPRGPGRPRKEQVEDERRRKRTERAGTLGYRLQIPEEKLELDKYKYRWVNGGAARIFQLTKQDDWDFVHQDGGEIKSDADHGSAINVPAGRDKDGQPVRAYLCRKRKDWWEQDQRQKAADIEEMMTQMRRGNDPDGSRQEGTYALDGNRI